MTQKLDNYVDESLQFLTYQFKGKENISALVSGFAEQQQTVENANWQLFTERYLDVAEGKQLDDIGKIVGEPRLGRDDDEYRDAISVRIIINDSSGEPASVISVFKIITDSTAVNLIEIEPATLVLQGDGPNLPENLFEIMNEVKVAGVRLIITSTGGETPFSFDGNDETKGFSAVGNLTGGHFIGVISNG